MAYSSREVLDRPRATPDWIIPGLLKRQNTMFTSGEPKKACKSWLLRAAAYDLAEQRPLWGIQSPKGGPMFVSPRPMRTVIFGNEDTADDCQDRCTLEAADGRTLDDHVWYVPKDFKYALDSVQGIAHITKELKEVEQRAGAIDLVVFDPMRRFHSASENDSEHIAEMWKALDGIHNKFNCSSWFAHHITKPPTAPNSNWDASSPYSMRGSSDIYGGGDAFVQVVPNPTHKANEHDLTLYFESKRAGGISPVRLLVDTSTAHVTFKSFLTAKGTVVPIATPHPYGKPKS